MAKPEPHLARHGPALGTDPEIGRRFAELEARLAQLVDLLTTRRRTERYDFSGNADGSGNGTIVVKTEVPAGFEFSLHRLILDDGTGTFNSTTTGGSYEILVNRERIDGGNLATVGLPTVWTASSSAGIFLRGGDELSIKLVGVGAHSKRVFGVCQGSLRRTPLGE